MECTVCMIMKWPAVNSSSHLYCYIYSIYANRWPTSAYNDVLYRFLRVIKSSVGSLSRSTWQSLALKKTQAWERPVFCHILYSLPIHDKFLLRPLTPCFSCALFHIYQYSPVLTTPHTTRFLQNPNVAILVHLGPCLKSIASIFAENQLQTCVSFLI